MSRYIDADAIRYHDMSDGQGMWYVWRDEIHEMPTADVVEVVRCKDCIHHKPFMGAYQCSVFDWVNTEEDYCSFAERKGRN